MSLEPRGFIDLPAHQGEGGFDHAAVHRALGRLYVAHTANGALDVIDLRRRQLVKSVPGLTGIAGALVSEDLGLVFTSNRGESTASVLGADDLREKARVKVGIRPNGLAFAPSRRLLLAANVGDPAGKGPFTVSFVDVKEARRVSDPEVPGRTRWSLYDAHARAFYVNVRDPPQVVVFDAADPSRVARAIPVPRAGPHGLDLDEGRRRLYCACDAATLVVLDPATGETLDERDLSGVPDVVFHNAAKDHLYVAIGDPGVIDVFDTKTMDRVQSCPTEKGAHTIGYDPSTNEVYAFLPASHRAAVFEDSASR